MLYNSPVSQASPTEYIDLYLFALYSYSKGWGSFLVVEQVDKKRTPNLGSIYWI